MISEYQTSSPPPPTHTIQTLISTHRVILLECEHFYYARVYCALGLLRQWYSPIQWVKRRKTHRSMYTDGQKKRYM